MDTRTALPGGTILDFPGLRCRIEAEIGRGSNAIAYRGYFEQSQREALIEELFPLRLEGGIFRGEDGAIVCASEGEADFARGRRAFLWGDAARRALLETQPVGSGARHDTFAFRGTLYSVMDFGHGQTLAAEMNAPATSLEPLTRRMLQVLEELECLHREGFLHLDIAPESILLSGRGEEERALLMNCEGCVPIGGELHPRAAAGGRMGYAAPEIRIGQRVEVGPWSDLYSVAAVFYRGIAGKALTPFQATRALPPDVSGFPGVRGLRKGAAALVGRILKRGLSALPSQRYRSAREMGKDVRGLSDCLDGANESISAAGCPSNGVS